MGTLACRRKSVRLSSPWRGTGSVDLAAIDLAHRGPDSGTAVTSTMEAGPLVAGPPPSCRGGERRAGRPRPPPDTGGPPRPPRPPPQEGAPPARSPRPGV